MQNFFEIGPGLEAPSPH